MSGPPNIRRFLCRRNSLPIVEKFTSGVKHVFLPQKFFVFVTLQFSPSYEQNIVFRVVQKKVDHCFMSGPLDLAPSRFRTKIQKVVRNSPNMCSSQEKYFECRDSRFSRFRGKSLFLWFMSGPPSRFEIPSQNRVVRSMYWSAHRSFTLELIKWRFN